MEPNERQLQILAAIVSEYVRTAEPVASKSIALDYGLDVSPATVRNDMAVLEALGLVRQPHTSAGRVPTEEGYRLYLENCVGDKCEPRGLTPQVLGNQRGFKSERERLREIAKQLVELSGDAALTSLDTDWNYHTGLSKLLEKPEFNEGNLLRDFSNMVDRFDEMVDDIFEEADKDMNVWIGSQNPLGSELATVLVRYRLPGGGTGIMGLVGPLRMNYERNIALLNEAKRLLDSPET